MSNVIRLKHSEKGIGVNFLNEHEEDNYKEIIESIKPLVSEEISLSAADVKWDLDNMELGHSDPVANQLLKNFTLQLAS